MVSGKSSHYYLSWNMITSPILLAGKGTLCTLINLKSNFSQLFLFCFNTYYIFVDKWYTSSFIPHLSISHVVTLITLTTIDLIQPITKAHEHFTSQAHLISINKWYTQLISCIKYNTHLNSKYFFNISSYIVTWQWDCTLA